MRAKGSRHLGAGNAPALPAPALASLHFVLFPFPVQSTLALTVGQGTTRFGIILEALVQALDHSLSNGI